MISHTHFFERKQREIGVSLNDTQKEAVLNHQGPLLLLASPGSGKTTTIIMKIGFLIEVIGVSPSRIKAVTFSRASAKDMEERFQRFFPYLPKVNFSTIHSLAYQVVREYFAKQRIDYQFIEGNNFEEQRNYRPLHKKQIIKDIFKMVNGERPTEDQLEEILTFISYIKNKLLPETKWGQISCNVPKVVQIVEKYEEYKKFATGKFLLDYDDMLTIANEVFEKDKDILFRYQQMYDYVLTDESQDTSFVQHSIIEKLVARHQNLCIVADEDQSIYSWRGAAPEYLLNFKKTYPNAKILMMLQNYRSSKDIVDVANRFIKQNKKRYDKDMFTENPTHKPIQFKKLLDYSTQANYLINEIKDIKNLDEVAILYRNNSSSILLMDAFDKANIPFYIKDSDNHFFNHWVVQDVLNFMRFSYDTKRIDIFEKIYSKIQGYININQLEELKRIQNNESVFDNLINFVNLKNYQINRMKKFKKSYEKIKIESPKNIMHIIRKDLGYEDSLEYISEHNGYNKDALFDILNTLEIIAESTNSMVEFANRLKELETLMRNSKFNKNKNVVTFSTFHSSKGLEFETVYMIDLIDGIIPSKSKGKKSDKMTEEELEKLEEEREEEVRLFYVGMTRAKFNLQLVTYFKRFDKSVKESEFFTQVEKLVNPNKNTQPKPNKIDTKKESKNKIEFNARTITESTALKVGMSVKHILFGEGEIVSCNDDILEIQFNNSGLKKFKTSVCLKQGYLERIE